MLKFFFELKNRIILTIFNVIFSLLLLYYYKEFFFYVLLNLADIPELEGNNSIYFILTNVTELFNSYITIQFFLIMLIVFYYNFYHFLLFFGPALYKSEFRILIAFYNFSILFLFLSFNISMCYAIPETWLFFVNYQNSLSIFLQTKIFFEIKVNEYIFFCVTILTLFFLGLQLILLIFFLYFTDNYFIKFGNRFKKFHHFLCLFFTIFFCPFDIAFQFVFFIIFIMSYELCTILIILIKILVR